MRGTEKRRSYHSASGLHGIRLRRSRYRRKRESSAQTEFLNRRFMESHRIADLPQVSQSHNPLASIGNLDRILGRESHLPDTIAIVTISNDPSYYHWLIGTIGNLHLLCCGHGLFQPLQE